MRLVSGTVSAAALAYLPRAVDGGETPRTGMGMVAYCQNLRRQLDKQRDSGVDLFDPITFLQHCHVLGAGGIQISIGVRDDAYSESLRRQSDELGMFVEGSVNPPRETDDLDRFEAEIWTAAKAGVRAVRTVIIPGRRYERFHSLAEFRQFDRRGRRSLQLAEPIVRRHGVRLAVENHKDHRVAERVELLQQLSSEYIGACLDTGNNLALLEDPITVAEMLAPWAFSVHLKDQAVKAYAHGFLLADVVLGQGCLDLPKMVDVIRSAQPDVKFSLETITRDPLKIPCLSPGYWATFPDVPARDLARTLRRVRDRSAQRLPHVSHLPWNEQVAMEAETVRDCLVYARDQLKLT